MSGLDKDCFDCGGDDRSMGMDAALARLSSRLRTVAGEETVPLRAALGRVLATDQTSALAVPGFDNAAVDGWAVFADDLSPQGPTLLPIGGRIAVGHPLRHAATRGKAYRVFTGAPLPTGPDAVVIQAQCRQEASLVVLPGRPVLGANIRRAAESMSPGDVALKAGCRLRAPEIGVAATIGLTHLPVRRSLRVAVFSTGEAIRAHGDALPEGCRYDSNRFALIALLDGLGCTVTDLGLPQDRQAPLQDVLSEAAASHELIMTSSGEEEQVKHAVATLGSLHLWRLALKPGTPVALGQIGAVPFLGLPGDAMAMMVAFLLFARPLIAKLTGATVIPPRRTALPAAFTLSKAVGFREFPPARVVDSGFGPVIALFPADSSGALASLTASDGLLDLPERAMEIAPGDMVDFLPFSEIMP